MALSFIWMGVGVSEQALGWFPLGFGLAVEDEPSEIFYCLGYLGYLEKYFYTL